MRRDHWSQLFDLRRQVYVPTCNPICLRVLRMVFVQKRRLSIFSYLLVLERSQYWPNLRSPISKFWDIHYLATVTRINYWKFQGNRLVGVAMTSILTFYKVRSLATWPDDLTLSDLGLIFFTTYAEKMHKLVCQKYVGLRVVRARVPVRKVRGSRHDGRLSLLAGVVTVGGRP